MRGSIREADTGFPLGAVCRDRSGLTDVTRRVRLCSNGPVRRMHIQPALVAVQEDDLG